MVGEAVPDAVTDAFPSAWQGMSIITSFAPFVVYPNPYTVPLIVLWDTDSQY